MVLYANVTSIIITDTNNLIFEINLHQTFKYIMTWFNVNLLTLNLNKTQYLNFDLVIVVVQRLILIMIKQLSPVLLKLNFLVSFLKILYLGNNILFWWSTKCPLYVMHLEK
jgi:hypothetical protein